MANFIVVSQQWHIDRSDFSRHLIERDGVTARSFDCIAYHEFGTL